MALVPHMAMSAVKAAAGQVGQVDISAAAAMVVALAHTMLDMRGLQKGTQMDPSKHYSTSFLVDVVLCVLFGALAGLTPQTPLMYEYSC